MSRAGRARPAVADPAVQDGLLAARYQLTGQLITDRRPPRPPL